MGLPQSDSFLVLHLVFMALHDQAALKYNVVDWSHVFGQFMTNCSLFDVSKYLDSRLIQADKTEKCQTHDFCLKHQDLGKLQQLY